ncbi:MAG: phosphate acyltransferase PlsX [Peptostreptococcaceae bacterium]|nr:phosphate acyltransferase PlsX [Peptostreptococcaceae bacterium]
MRIVIDAMGGDNAPKAIIEGCMLALETKAIESEILLVGHREQIIETFNELNLSIPENIQIHHTSECITAEDKPAKAIRGKKDSSMVVAYEILNKGEADAMLSAGNTGALLAGGIFLTGRIDGISRPALAPAYPTQKGFTLLLDAGANADCKPSNLMEFAIMGSQYMKKVFEIDSPRVGLINIGDEAGKGNKLTNEAYGLMSDSVEINFGGNLEARNLPEGLFDVAVCDGFTGNTVLKLTEGVAMNLMKIIKSHMTDTLKHKIGAFLLRDAFEKIKKEMDYTEYGGAPLLGLKRPIVKAHGSSNAKAIKNALVYAEIYAKSKVIESIEEKVSK